VRQSEPASYGVEKVPPLPARGPRKAPERSGEPERPPRPIRIRAGEQPRVVDEAEAALIAAEMPIYVRAGRLVRPIMEEAPAADGRTTIVARLKALCPDSAWPAPIRWPRFEVSASSVA